MREPNWDWIDARDELKETLTDIGHPAELGDLIARHLGSPRAIRRMAAYLRYERPASVETIADEMLSIRSEIDAWREKKESEEANAVINTLLYRHDWEED